MVYKKYIVRNGKTYGPYTYHSRRVNGRVVSDYHGVKPQTDYKRFLFPILMIVVLFALVFAGVNFVDRNISGQAVFGIEANYVEGENLDGVFRLSLKEGELLPSDSKLIFQTSSGKTYEYVLSDLVADEVAEGDFYVEGKTLSGTGEGYGVVGVKEIYPGVEFVLEILEEKAKKEKEDTTEEIEETENETAPLGVPQITEQGGKEQEVEVVEENETEIIEEIEGETEQGGKETETEVEEIIEEPEEETESIDIIPGTEEEQEVAETPESEPAAPEPSVEDTGITGGIIRGIGGIFNFFQGIATTTGQVALELENEIGGVVTGDSSFSYKLLEGQTASLKPESVSTGEDGDVKVVVEDDQVIVTTDYSEEEEGFGGEYLGGVGKEILIDLSQLEVVAEQGELTIEVVYGEDNLVSIVAELQVEGSLNESGVSGEYVSEDSNETILEIKIEEFVLTEAELEILSEVFVNFTLSDIETLKAEVVNDRLFLKHELGTYWIEYTYDYDGMSNSLQEQIENDKIKWLKDIAVSLDKEEIESEDVRGLLNKKVEIEEEQEVVEEVEESSSEEIEVNETIEDLTNETLG